MTKNKIGVFSANGRMGSALLEAASTKEHSELAAAYATQMISPLLGINVNQLNSAADKTVTFSDEANITNVDVLIDFTLPAGMRTHLQTAVKQGVPIGNWYHRAKRSRYDIATRGCKPYSYCICAQL